VLHVPLVYLNPCRGFLPSMECCRPIIGSPLGCPLHISKVGGHWAGPRYLERFLKGFLRLYWESRSVGFSD
jgi:hypothetical protein